MKTAPVAEIKARFSSYLEPCERGPVIVTKNGRPVAVLLSVKAPRPPGRGLVPSAETVAP